MYVWVRGNGGGVCDAGRGIKNSHSQTLLSKRQKHYAPEFWCMLISAVFIKFPVLSCNQKSYTLKGSTTGEGFINVKFFFDLFGRSRSFPTMWLGQNRLQLHWKAYNRLNNFVSKHPLHKARITDCIRHCMMILAWWVKAECERKKNKRWKKQR